MSRHKLVKTMDLDDELDNFDGGEDYDYEEGLDGQEELSPADKEQMREGTAKVRSILDSEDSVTDKEIQDSLWHYYYDVEKTVNYLLNQKSEQSRISKKTADGRAAKADGIYTSARYAEKVEPCSSAFSASDFFKDSPWLNVPSYRRAEITIEPLYPRGRLLGGSSTEGGQKVSKLAALAAARKKKENEQLNGRAPKLSTTSVALLDKLSGKSKSNIEPPKDDFATATSVKTAELKADRQTSIPQSRKYPLWRQKSPSPPPPSRPPKDPLEPVDEYGAGPNRISAPPSSFARTMLGPSLEPVQQDQRPPKFFHSLFSPTFVSGVITAESDAFAGPSPDDIVTKAQNSKGLKTNKGLSQPVVGDKGLNGVMNGVGKVALDEAPRATSKNLNVLSEFEKSKTKNAANFVVIGHVDAGKSTLMGRLLYDLKVVDQRTIDRYRKEADTIGKSSFALAWVLDQGTEERNRGVTIDIAMNKFETEKTSFTILDAPGHRDFIPNMIAGASQADFAVLVIDANTGSFESGLKGQTKEHALLVRSMGVQRIIVAINKLDTVDWSKDRFEEIEQQVSAFLTSAGFQPKNVSFIPCSGLTGDNIVRRVTDSKASWHSGPIFIEQLENSEPIARALEKPLRLTIGDIFRGGVQNPLSISGRLDAGSIQVGDKIIAMPSSESAYIKGIEIDQHEPSDWAVAGQNVTLHLTDIDQIHLKTGDVICPPTAPIKNISTFTTKILAFDHVTPMHVDVHRGRLHAPGRITQLVAVLDKGSGAVTKKKPKLIQPGSVARVVVEMEQAVPLEAPGRVVLRSGGETVAAGLLE